MSKSIPLFIVSLLGIAAIAFAVQQTSEVKKMKINLSNIEVEKDEITDSLIDAEEKIVDLEDENEALYEQIAILKDSLLEYEGIIDELNGRINRRNKTIKKMKKDMEQLRSKYFDVENQIAVLQKDAKANQDALQQLQAERDQLRAENDSLYIESTGIQQEVAAASADILELEIEKNKQADLISILENTDIFFEDIFLLKALDGPRQKKIKKDGRAWNYTMVNLVLSHPNERLLLNEQFVLKLIDLDNETDLAYIESNPAFPDSPNNHTGYLFQYEGEPIQLSFSNNEIKTGENYAIQLYYLKDGKEYKLDAGYRQFIKDEKIQKADPLTTKPDFM